MKKITSSPKSAASFSGEKFMTTSNVERKNIRKSSMPSQCFFFAVKNETFRIPSTNKQSTDDAMRPIDIDDEDNITYDSSGMNIKNTKLNTIASVYLGTNML
jgi:hypothetical protein